QPEQPQPEQPQPEQPQPEQPQPEQPQPEQPQPEQPQPEQPQPVQKRTIVPSVNKDEISDDKVKSFINKYGAYNLFTPSNNMDWQALVEHLNTPDPKYGLQLWFMPREKELVARSGNQAKEGIVFENVSEKFVDVLPALDNSKRYITKKGFPNTNLRVEFNSENGQVKVYYYLVSINSEGKTESSTGHYGPYWSEFFIPAKYLKTTNTSNREEGSTSNPVADKTLTIDNSFDASKLIYDPSNNYYESLNGLYGEKLMNALVQLQASKQEQGNYDSLKNFYNTSNAFKDKYFEKDNTMLDVYSENPVGKDPYVYQSYPTSNAAKKEGDGMNREHLIPQSWFAKVDKMRNDPFHVFPTDIKVNGVRGNDPHDVVKNATWTSLNGGKLGTGSMGYQVFEPIDAFKGDIARAYLYFAFTYARENKYNGNGNLVFQQSAPYLKNHYLEVYLNWHKKDRVNQFDIIRNNETSKFTHQKRRNPFIDYPTIEESLFGTKPFVNKGILVGIKQ
ncbi:hypothetical protein D1113_03275, partial [Mycoplasmopsis gallopavonis]